MPEIRIEIPGAEKAEATCNRVQGKVIYRLADKEDRRK